MTRQIQMKSFALLQILGLLICSMSTVFAAPMDILETRLSQFQSWSGTFDQTVTNEKGDIIQSVEGALDIQKPMKFHWQTQEPFPQLVVSNGQVLWVYDQDLEQVVIRDMDAGMAPLPAAILSGQADVLHDLFNVDQYSEPRAGVQIFHLQPKSDQHAGEFDKLTIEFTSGAISRLELHDALGQTTTLVMNSRLDTPKMNQERFEFVPPQEVDIIDERALLR